MITVTEQALELLDAIRSAALAQATLPADQTEPTLRLIIHENQAGLALDHPRAGDQVFERAGHPVLVVDAEVGQILAGMTVGVRETAAGEQLTLEQASDQEPA